MLASLLNKFGFRLVFEFDKFMLSKSDMFVGKGYHCNGMFKLNVLTIRNNKIDIISAYLVEFSFGLWHNIFGHINYRKMHKMMRPDLLLYCDNNEGKCKTCVLTKITRNSFSKVERSSKILILFIAMYDICMALLLRVVKSIL